MSEIGFGKGECLSNVAAHPLTQGVVPPFHRGRLSNFFPNTTMGFSGKDLLIGRLKITEGMAVLIFIRDGLPQAKAGSFPAVANGKACPSAHRCPQPSCAFFF